MIVRCDVLRVRRDQTAVGANLSPGIYALLYWSERATNESLQRQMERGLMSCPLEFGSKRVSAESALKHPLLRLHQRNDILMARFLRALLGMMTPV